MKGRLLVLEIIKKSQFLKLRDHPDPDPPDSNGVDDGHRPDRDDIDDRLHCDGDDLDDNNCDDRDDRHGDRHDQQHRRGGDGQPDADDYRDHGNIPSQQDPQQQHQQQGHEQRRNQWPIYNDNKFFQFGGSTSMYSGYGFGKLFSSHHFGLPEKTQIYIHIFFAGLEQLGNGKNESFHRYYYIIYFVSPKTQSEANKLQQTTTALHRPSTSKVDKPLVFFCRTWT